jgi:hypothetical protein
MRHMPRPPSTYRLTCIYTYRTVKTAVVTYFRVVRLGNTTEILVQNSLCSGRDSNRAKSQKQII